MDGLKEMVESEEKRWIWLYDDESVIGSTFRVCSHCNAIYHINSGDGLYNYCPNCGKRMDG